MVVAEDSGQKHIHDFDETAMLLMTDKDDDPGEAATDGVMMVLIGVYWRPDASANGIGAVLLQNSHPISYFGRKLGPIMSLVASYQKEVVIEFLEEFQEGQPLEEPIAICDWREVFIKTAMQRR
ncbi:hypothetical protein Tco_0996192 [Tanacetum coccineum]